MESSLTELIDRLGQVRRAGRRAAAGRAGLSLAQLDALHYLAECNRFSNTPAAVAEYLEATRGTTSQSLRALERKGLVERREDAHDGRVSHLLPTPAGRAIVADDDGREIDRAIDTLGPAAEELAARLTAILRAAQRARGGRTFGHCAGCRHLRGPAGERRCGLTDEPLSDAETTQICIEHEPATA